MESFIKKIFDGKTDSLVHLQFQKFSKGEYTGRAGFILKNSKDKFTISTCLEPGPAILVTRQQAAVLIYLGVNKVH